MEALRTGPVQKRGQGSAAGSVYHGAMPLFTPFFVVRTVPLALCLSAALLAGCAAPEPDRLPARTQQDLLPTDVLLLGEQHDAPEHQALQQATVQWLVGRGELAALVLEMAERGRSTAALPADASERAVQSALRWSDAAWPWASYGPVAMAAVRAGVPVLGGNLPRKALSSATTDAALDARLPPEAWQRQQDAVREGHCGLLPEKMLPGMVRVQIARDISMAQTAAQAHRPGKVVLLVAGNGHVLRSLGVPLHLPANLRSKVVAAQAGSAQAAIESEADWVQLTSPLPPSDACAELREQWQQAPPTPGPAF